MNIVDSPDEAAFRREAREWLSDNIPDRLRGAESFDDRLMLDRLMADGGYIGLTWPEAYGGRGLSLVDASIFDEEATLSGLEMAKSPSRIGQQMMAPAVMAHGAPAQRTRYLPPVLSVKEIWCQGFSEPDAGSDLASVRTSAVLSNGEYHIEGSKLWTTQAQYADWCLLLARSEKEAPRHKNLTMLLVDMHQPGITVSPITQINGDAEFNEVHFHGATAPSTQVVGSAGEGWRVAMTTLSSERSYALRGKYVLFSAQLARIARLIKLAGPTHPLRSSWSEQLGRLHCDVAGIRNLSYLFGSRVSAGEATTELGPVAHLWWTGAHQRLVEFGYLVASNTHTDIDYWYHAWLTARAESIYGGSAQIQRNIIAERALGLPR